MRIDTHLLALPVILFCAAHIHAAISEQDGIATYLEVRYHRYFGTPVSYHLQGEFEVFEQQHPRLFAQLNMLTNNAQMPGKRFMPTPWLPRYMDSVAQTFSRWFGWHDAILDALRPSFDVQQTTYHEQNVSAYLDAVGQYLYHQQNIAAYQPRDIFIGLITRLELNAVHAIPYRDNLFAQLCPLIREDDMAYMRKQLQYMDPETYQAKIDMATELLRHFDHLDTALYAAIQEIQREQTEQSAS